MKVKYLFKLVNKQIGLSKDASSITNAFSKINRKYYTAINNNLKTRNATYQLVIDRDNYFKNLLNEKSDLSAHELTNIARIISKENIRSIDKDNLKKFDSQVLKYVNSMDIQQLRQIMSFYALSNYENSSVFYEIKERLKVVGYNNYVLEQSKQSSIQKSYLALYRFRNKFFSLVNNFTGLQIK